MAMSTDPPPAVMGHRHGRVPREVRHKQLLDISEQIFLTKGYDGFSIEELRRSAGVSRPVVYEHFRSKEAIFIACITRIWEIYETSLLDSAANVHTFKDVVVGASDAYFRTLESNPRAWELLNNARGINVTVDGELDRLRELSVQRIVELGKVLTPNMGHERIEAYSHIISGAAEDLGRWWSRNLDIPRSRIVEYHTDAILALAGRFADITDSV